MGKLQQVVIKRVQPQRSSARGLGVIGFRVYRVQGLGFVGTGPRVYNRV